MGGVPAGAGLMVGLLGPVEIGPAAGVTAPVEQTQLRVLLGLLGVAAGRVVSAEALVDGLWGEEWSGRRERNLHALVYQLRRRLAALEPGRGGARLTRAGIGYRLVLGPGELDVTVFTDLAGRGREAARAGDVEQARELFGDALGLWRGEALADAAPLCARLAGEAGRLEELRLTVAEERIGCDLALGRHAEVAGELAALVAQCPLRERLVALLMTALYRCGRRGEALAVFDTARRVLAEQLGLDPGPELAGLQAKILADDPALAAPGGPSGAAPPQAAAGIVVPQQLPAGAGFFAGREAELKELDALLGQVGGAGGTVVISAVAGMAGVGKTALAVHWARRVAGRFPDGQLYVNLRGYHAGPAVTPEEATGWFLVALGVPAAQVPADAPARCGLYRSVLAGRRVLIVLDNARDAEQVRPLLPGGGGCLVVVTSRSALGGLAAAEGAHTLRLGLLSVEEAVRLLAARLGPERVAAEPEAVTELIARCGHLPLALAVMAARAAADPELPLGVLAAQLAGAAHAEAAAGHGAAGAGLGRLEVLETGDAATSLRELLSWSHRQLSDPAAAMLALLGVHCGPDITVPAAASLAGVSRAEAGRALAELAGASLVAEPRPGRHVMHDLVHSYAACCLDERPDADEVRDRHAAYFASEVGELAAEQQDREWDRADVNNLRAAADWSHTRDLAMAVRVSYRLLAHLVETGQLNEAEQRATALLEAPLKTRDQIRVHLIRQDIAFKRGRKAESLAEVHTALQLARASGDAWGVARATHALAWHAMLDDDVTTARRLSDEGIRAAEDAGDDRLAARFANTLGAVALKSSDLAGAREHFADSARRAFAHGDKAGGVIALINLAMGYLCEGDLAAGRGQLDVILGLLRDLEMPQFELLAVELVGAAALIAGEPTAAAESFTRALDLRAAHRVETGLSTDVGGVGAALWLARRPADAIALFAACDRLVAYNPAHEADETLHLPLRQRFAAEAQAALSETAADRAARRLASLDTAMTAAAARNLAASLLADGDTGWPGPRRAPRAGPGPQSL